MSELQLAHRKTRFREAMSRLPAAVHIVTTDGMAGRGGITASAVCSVTDEPPILLVCINRRSGLNVVLKRNGVLAVNTLGAGHEDISGQFARHSCKPSSDRFPARHWSILATGSPVLNDALVSLDGPIVDVKEVGSHSVFFVEALEVALREERAGLVYFRREYRSVASA